MGLGGQVVRECDPHTRPPSRPEPSVRGAFDRRNVLRAASALHGVRIELSRHSFLNGTLVAKSAAFRDDTYSILNDQPLKIGFGQHDFFNGRLNDVRLYGKALTNSEIAELRLKPVSARQSGMMTALTTSQSETNR